MIHIPHSQHHHQELLHLLVVAAPEEVYHCDDCARIPLMTRSHGSIKLKNEKEF